MTDLDVQPATPDLVLMPRNLTAGNGAKAALWSEFHIKRAVACHECEGSGETADEDGETCPECDGAGELIDTVDIPWTVIKEIYGKAVETLASPQAIQDDAVAEMYRKAIKHSIEVGVFKGAMYSHAVTALHMLAAVPQPPTGRQLPNDIGRAVQAFQLAELAFLDDIEQRGLLFDPALSVEAGLRAAAPFLVVSTSGSSSAAPPLTGHAPGATP